MTMGIHGGTLIQSLITLNQHQMPIFSVFYGLVHLTISKYYLQMSSNSFLTLTRNFVKKCVFHKILQKKVEDGPYPESNQVMPMPMGISRQIISQIGPPVLELTCRQAFLTF